MSNVTTDTVATIFGATTLVAGTLATMAKYFIRSVISDELQKFRDYLDGKFNNHLRNDHGYSGYIGRGGVKKPRPVTYRPSDEEHVDG